MTEFKIEKTRNSFIATKNGKIISSCATQEASLQSIWVLSGKVEGHYYSMSRNGSVTLSILRDI